MSDISNTNHPLLSTLNAKQREVVAHPAGHLLVLAGAGSGKTRVLVHRIAYLIQDLQTSPFAILAVTFTNKAAAEMRSRIEELLARSTQGMWVGTFHSLAHRMLRAHWREARLPEQFQILDSDDQYRLIKRILKMLNLEESDWSPRRVQGFINAQKDDGLRAKDIDPQGDITLTTLTKLYQHYEDACERGGLVDFAELLLRAYELWRDVPQVLEHYQQRFTNILVDEFQDTNSIQYAWLKMLAGNGAQVMIVGDDDQSIYGWRGAKIDNIHRFTDDFPGTTTIRLEQNYRSTKTILAAANAVIACNDERMGKELWTEGAEGEPIAVYSAFNEIDESRFIVYNIKLAANNGYACKDQAILYRSNAQSRVLEEALIQQGIPYRIYGGLRFYERAEIKDALSYMRLVAHRDDDAALERVVNNPPRGIGERTIAEIRHHAQQQGCSLWQASINIITEKSLSARANNALVAFLQLIDEMEAESEKLTLSEQMHLVINLSGLRAHLGKSKHEKAQNKLDNLDELITACKQYTPEPDENLPTLVAFLNHVALESGEQQGEAYQDCVQLMTLHAAKGLEFPIVYMAGVEEGLFPSQMSLDESGRLEEERRLCYVGMTRAMERLFMSHAEVRRQYGSEMYHRPSRFLREIPKKYLQAVRFENMASSSMSHARQSQSYGRTQSKQQHTQMPAAMKTNAIGDSGLSLGQAVAHPTFGEGVITDFQGSGPQTRVQVNFAAHGAKWLLLNYAKLEAITSV